MPRHAFIHHYDSTDMIQDTRPHNPKVRNLTHHAAILLNFNGLALALTSNVAIRDWDGLSIAVMARLRLAMRPNIGIAVCPAEGASSEPLIKNADATMSRTKRHQTGYAFLDECACSL